MADLPLRSGRSERLQAALMALLDQAPELEAAAVVSFDGLPMASVLPPAMDEDRVAAMSAALLSLGEKAAEGLGRGDLSQVYVEGAAGTVFLMSCDNEAVLVAVASRGAKAGLMMYEVRRAAQQIGSVLRIDDDADPAPIDWAGADRSAESSHQRFVDQAALLEAEAAYAAHRAAYAEKAESSAAPMHEPEPERSPEPERGHSSAVLMPPDTKTFTSVFDSMDGPIADRWSAPWDGQVEQATSSEWPEGG